MLLLQRLLLVGTSTVMWQPLAQVARHHHHLVLLVNY
jgi:hypothetical protein